MFSKIRVKSIMNSKESRRKLSFAPNGADYYRQSVTAEFKTNSLVIG